MKRGTPDHPKTMMLAALLKIPRAHACGILEVMWQWAGRYAIQGDIGKWDDEVIAAAVDWSGDARVLIDALTKARWLDKVPAPHRLVIHDIKIHADNTWRQNLADTGLNWWDGTPARGKGRGCRTDLQYSEAGQATTSSQPQENLKRTSSQPPQPEPEPEPEPDTPPAPSQGESVCLGPDEILLRKPGRAKKAKPAGDIASTQWVYVLWNTLAHPGLPRLDCGWTADHHDAALALIARHGEERFRDMLETAVEKINHSPFCLGQTEHKHRMTLSGLLGMQSNRNLLANVLSGAYDQAADAPEAADRGQEEEPDDPSAPRPIPPSPYADLFTSSRAASADQAGRVDA